MTLTIPTINFADGTPIPLVGLGTYGLQGNPGADAVAAALQQGYRLLDTAAQYNNETAIGEGIRRSGVPRDEVLITTKVAGGSHGRAATRTAVDESRRRLGVDTIDIMLIHWPNPSRGLTVETWETLVQLKEEGAITHIGVSNFRPEQLTELHDATGAWPAMNQIQLSPALARTEAVQFHAEHGIVTEAWGPLGKREGLLDQLVVHKIAAKHGVDPRQVVLKWIVDRGIVVIPKSKNPERQASNATFEFELDDDDRALLASLDLGEEHAWDSREHEEW
ncbi:aldo/keto reductase [uncultured Tessaracoccus sp.]|uniref:aldo/keto reductase n=1 Tax=uncultured Tessaracoccus sp. TaxID=905023 RepID=UPI002624285B|nr:aldo/keto reductase [uncultured Tessaracoccus sp.]